MVKGLMNQKNMDIFAYKFCILPGKLGAVTYTYFPLNLILTFKPFIVLILFYISASLKDFKIFMDAMEAVKDKGVVVAVASPEDVDTANKDRPDFFQVKKAL